MTTQAQQGWVEVGAEQAAQAPYKFFRFSKIGDQLIGKLSAIKENVPSQFPNGKPETHYIFDTPEGAVAINANADLKKRYSVLKLGDMVRTTYVSDLDIGQPSPMKVSKVEKFSGGTAAPGKAPF